MPFNNETPEILAVRKNIEKVEAALQKARDSFKTNSESLTRMEKKYKNLKFQHGEDISDEVQKELLQLEANIKSKKDCFEKFKPENVIARLEGLLKNYKEELERLTTQVSLDGMHGRVGANPAKMSL